MIKNHCLTDTQILRHAAGDFCDWTEFIFGNDAIRVHWATVEQVVEIELASVNQIFLLAAVFYPLVHVRDP